MNNEELNNFQKEVNKLIGHLPNKRQCEVTERAVYLLGTELTDRTYLSKLKELV